MTRTNSELSETEVTRRLEEVRALFKLMLSLREVRLDQARPVDPVRER